MIIKSVAATLTVITQEATQVTPSLSVHFKVTVACVLAGVSFLAVTVIYCPFVSLSETYSSPSTVHSNCDASATASEPMTPCKSNVLPTAILVSDIFKENVFTTVTLTVTVSVPVGKPGISSVETDPFSFTDNFALPSAFVRTNISASSIEMIELPVAPKTVAVNFFFRTSLGMLNAVDRS